MKIENVRFKVYYGNGNKFENHYDCFLWNDAVRKADEFSKTYDNVQIVDVEDAEAMKQIIDTIDKSINVKFDKTKHKGKLPIGRK